MRLGSVSVIETDLTRHWRIDQELPSASKLIEVFRQQIAILRSADCGAGMDAAMQERAPPT